MSRSRWPFVGTDAVEWLYDFDFFTRAEVRLAIFDYIETLYNPSRLHSTINYRGKIGRCSTSSGRVCDIEGRIGDCQLRQEVRW